MSVAISDELMALLREGRRVYIDASYLAKGEAMTVVCGEEEERVVVVRPSHHCDLAGRMRQLVRMERL